MNNKTWTEVNGGSVSAQGICDILNDLLEKDRQAAEVLINNRTYCTKAVLEDTKIFVRTNVKDNTYNFGIIGILNSFFPKRPDGMGQLCYELDRDNKISEFKLTPDKKVMVV